MGISREVGVGVRVIMATMQDPVDGGEDFSLCSAM